MNGSSKAFMLLDYGLATSTVSDINAAIAAPLSTGACSDGKERLC
jgi:hypothetical protein